MDIRELDRRAVQASVEVVAEVRPGDLERPTPCAGWTLADLLAHMTAQHLGFAAAAEGRGADPDVWRERPGPDPVWAYAAAAERVITAFAAEGVLDRGFVLPEVGVDAPFPAVHAIGFHFIDYLVHGWDVARALGIAYEPAPDLAKAAWPIALAVPDGDYRERPGAAFAPSVPAAPDASRFDQILARLGRTPAHGSSSPQ
ncbi:TIGR03086 family metal-binding protein [Microbispora sp. KK1-11]|uniref:TIGR03086 family metal-binding protein n=1 Tax=Microbispora sp. KK1-11 TaxID=2053005 RepID=UPI00115A9E61|nr:TIGR03086 family metal-binding protein [Microbispora sp. KK1-11]TQS27758.1 TIGR03086 family protein [Microbispora sp. KK1-11]